MRLILLALMILFSPLLIRAGGVVPSKTDTVHTFKLLNAFFNKTSEVNIANATFDTYIDSLLKINSFSENEQLLLIHVKHLYKLETDEYQFLIDSILDLDSIPPCFIHAVEYCMNLLFDDDLLVYECDNNHNDNLGNYPASLTYNNIWCHMTPNPYPPDITENDSIIELFLIQDTVGFCMPCDESPVTSKYGWRDGRMHHGIDLGINYSLPIYSSFDGVVRFARFYKGYGRLVIIRHNNGLETFYAHLSRINVKPNQEVKAGELIGRAGNSGNSNGTHLHYEVRYKGIPINPAHIISFTENRLMYEKVILKKLKQSFFVYNEDAILYSVQKGDYLHKIASEYGTTVNKLCEINDLSRNSRLKVGQLLKIEL